MSKRPGLLPFKNVTPCKLRCPDNLPEGNHVFIDINRNSSQCVACGCVQMKPCYKMPCKRDEDGNHNFRKVENDLYICKKCGCEKIPSRNNTSRNRKGNSRNYSRKNNNYGK